MRYNINIQELTTWDRLVRLDFDAADAALRFSARLARENGWRPAFAAKALEEYRKFCFLAVHAGHPVTPSDEVDQVWHLHLLYSRHYWDALCRDALGRPLHHEPTEGGAAEDRKFHDWYANTLASYRRYFGEPPKDIWPDAGERFDERHDFVRVDRRDVVTIDRTLARRSALASLGAGALVAVAHAIAQTDEAARSSSGLEAFVALLFVAAVGIFITLIIVATKKRRAPHRRADKHRSADGAAAAGGGFVGCSSSKHSHGDGNGDGQGNADGGAGDGGAGGCGSSGCGGGGGGCGGGGGS